MSGPNFDHMDQGIYENREGLKALEKAIANAVDVDWEAIKNAEPYAISAGESANTAAQKAAEATMAAAAASAAVTEATEAATAAAQAVIGSKQDVLTPGSGIKIEGNVISATGGGGTSDYNSLANRPTLGGQTVEGSHDLAYYGIASASALSNLADIVGQANAILEEV